jgi:NTE family protein
MSTLDLLTSPPATSPVDGRGRGSRSAPRTAFVLSGGASLGAAQVGMIQALYDRHVVPDLLVGTSAGALNAAYLASRPPTPATARELDGVWQGLRRESVFPVSPRTVLGGLTNVRDHLVPDRGLRALAQAHLEFERLEDAAIPVHLIACDLLSGAEVRLASGPALGAVLAAAAIPGVLPPVTWGNQLLVDGGVLNNTPISHAVELGAERIYVLTTDDPTHRGIPAPPRGALDAAVHAFTLLIATRLEADLRRYGREVELIVLPVVNPLHVLPTDFSHASSLIDASFASAQAILGAARPHATLRV